MISSNLAPLTQRPTWQKLEDHYHMTHDMHLRTLFADDPLRGERFALEAVGIYLDPRFVQRAALSAQGASPARSMLALFPGKGSELALPAASRSVRKEAF